MALKNVVIRVTQNDHIESRPVAVCSAVAAAINRVLRDPYYAEVGDTILAILDRSKPDGARAAFISGLPPLVRKRQLEKSMEPMSFVLQINEDLIVCPANKPINANT